MFKVLTNGEGRSQSAYLLHLIIDSPFEGIKLFILSFNSAQRKVKSVWRLKTGRLLDGNVGVSKRIISRICVALIT